MEIQQAWLVKIHKNLLDQKNKIHKKDFRFFQIDILLELARRTQVLSHKCDKCKQNKQIIENLSLSAADKIDTIKGRNEITKQIDAIIKHLKKDHKIYIKNYFIATYTFWGILLGGILGYLTSLLFSQLTPITGIMIGFIIGLVVGRILGNYFEKKAHKEQRLIKPQIISPLEEIINSQKTK